MRFSRFASTVKHFHYINVFSIFYGNRLAYQHGSEKKDILRRMYAHRKILVRRPGTHAVFRDVSQTLQRLVFYRSGAAILEI